MSSGIFGSKYLNQDRRLKKTTNMTHMNIAGSVGTWNKFQAMK